MSAARDIMKEYRYLLTRPEDFNPLTPNEPEPHVPLDVLMDILEGKVSMRILDSFGHVSGGCEICSANVRAFTKDRWVIPPACLRCEMAGMCEFKEDPTECESLHVCNGTGENAKFRGQPCAMRGGFPTFFAVVGEPKEACPCDAPALASLGRLQRPSSRLSSINWDYYR